MIARMKRHAFSILLSFAATGLAVAADRQAVEQPPRRVRLTQLSGRGLALGSARRQRCTSLRSI